MINRTSYILFTLGVLGACVFFYLRQDVDYNANGPVEMSAEQVETELAIISEKLGFSLDSLAIGSMFRQHTNFVKGLEDSLGRDIKPGILNQQKANTQSWVNVIGNRRELAGMPVTPNGLFSQVGMLKIHFANYGKVIRLESHEDRVNPIFVQGDSLESISRMLVSDVFGYDLSNYSIISGLQNNQFTSDSEEQVFTPQRLDNGSNGDSGIEINWRKNSADIDGPDIIDIALEPVVREFETESGFNTRFGYSIKSFIARDELEPENLGYLDISVATLFDYVLFGSALILALFVFALGIRNVFKGRVEWRRALFIFIAITLTFYGWRSIFYFSVFGDFLNGTGIFTVTLNSLLYALVVGLYAALAYICWEAHARTNKSGQVELMDAAWQRKFFVRETGSAMLHGLFVGGLLLGVFSLVLYFMDSYFIQTDSQFGYSEASIKPKILTINMAAWSQTWLIGFAQVGFVYGLAHEWIKNKWASLLVSFILASIFITVLGRLIGTPEDIFGDLIIFSALAFILILAYRNYGIVTVNTAWWTFACVLLVIPYMGSESIEMVSATWTQWFLILSVFAVSITAYRFGVPVSEVGDYIPEYQERIAQHLRMEKEIEIARESQYKLMPVQAPKAEGIDVYGFFLPSFEVGGDYFDYVLATNSDGTPKSLTMTVVDVSGKAMRAAMPAIFTSGLLLSRMKEDSPDKILTDVSEPIFTRTDKRTFITCVIARYDFETKSLSIANAGHCKPVIKRHGAADFIQTPEPRYPLGIRQEVQYKAQDFKTKPGDVLLLYSDGLPEAVNEKGERFGFEEVPRLLERIDTENLSANEIAQEIKRTVQKFSNYQLVDDTTVICLKV